MSDRSISGQIYIHDFFRKHGEKAPPEAGPEPFLAIVWHRRGCCRKKMLRVFLNPDGWHVNVEPFRVSPADWAARAVDQGAVPDAAALESFPPRRKLDHREPVSLALDIDAWDKATFEVGCNHSTSWHTTDELQDDARDFRRTHRRVTRSK